MKAIKSIDDLAKYISKIVEIETEVYPSDVWGFASDGVDYIDGIPVGIVENNWYFICEINGGDLYIVDFAKKPSYRMTIKDMMAIKTLIESTIKEFNIRTLSASMRETTSYKFKRLISRWYTLVAEEIDFTDSNGEAYYYLEWEV